MKIISLFTASIAFLLFSSFQIDPSEKITVSGVVLSASGKPVSGVLVAVTPGEEEALSKEKGEFSIQTSRQTPFTLTAEHWDFSKATVTVTDATKRITIRLQPRK